MITPVFNLEKSLQVILYVAKRLKRKDFHKIFKVIYFADREHLSKYGRSITGDSYIAMSDGPVPTNIYDIFKALRGDGFFADKAKDFEKYFEVRSWSFINPIAQVDMDELSQSDIQMLDDSLKKYGNLSWNEIREKSHDYAWRNTPRDGRISIEDILQENGEDPEFIKYIVEMTSLEKAIS